MVTALLLLFCCYIVFICVRKSKEYGTRLQDIERNTVIGWSDSFLRFLEILDITVGTGYKASDVFSKEEFFIHDMSSSATVKKYDILYVRLYPVGNIIRFAGGVISLPRRYLPYIKEYVLHNIMKSEKTSTRGTKYEFSPYPVTHLKDESLSIIHLRRCNDIIQNPGGKYLDHLADKHSELQGAIKENMEEDDLGYNNSGINDTVDETFEEEIPDSVKQQANDYFEKYYENWINMKIPTLHNMTPLEIVKTEEGRAMLEDLLRELENERARSTIEDLSVFPVKKIRQRLGL